MADIENHWFAGRLFYLGRSLPNGTTWKRRASDTFPRFKSDTKAECQRKGAKDRFFANAVSPFATLLGPVTFFLSQKELHREIVVGSTSDPLVNWLGWSMEEIRSRWNWALGSVFLNNSEFSLTWWLAWNALLLFG